MPLGALLQTLRRPAARATRCLVCLSAPTLLLGRSQLTLQCSDTLPCCRFIAQTLHCSGALMPWYSPAPTLYCSDALLLAPRAPMLTAPTLCGPSPTPCCGPVAPTPDRSDVPLLCKPGRSDAPRSGAHPSQLFPPPLRQPDRGRTIKSSCPLIPVTNNIPQTAALQRHGSVCAGVVSSRSARDMPHNCPLQRQCPGIAQTSKFNKALPLDVDRTSHSSHSLISFSSY